MHPESESNVPAPPSYDYLESHHEFAGTSASNDKKAPLPKEPEPTVTQPLLYPSQLTAPPAATTSNAGGVTVYHYVHPVTQERVDSLLPPTHPEMQCLQYGHMAHTKFGWLGIFAAIFWFPLGVGCLLLDRKVQCDRCKKTIERGVFD